VAPKERLEPLPLPILATAYHMLKDGTVYQDLGSNQCDNRAKGDLDMQAFFLSNMVETFGYAIVLRRPSGLSLARARAETLRAILAYLRG
jgi:hypothetical protein